MTEPSYEKTDSTTTSHFYSTLVFNNTNSVTSNDLSDIKKRLRLVLASSVIANEGWTSQISRKIDIGILKEKVVAVFKYTCNGGDVEKNKSFLEGDVSQVAKQLAVMLSLFKD